MEQKNKPSLKFDYIKHESSSSSSENENDDSSDGDDLEDEAAKYEPFEERDHFHDQDPPLVALASKKQRRDKVSRRRKPLAPVGFQGAVEKAKRKGDLTFTFPVVEGIDDEDPIWKPLSLKILKELQTVVKTLGACTLYTLQVLEMVASNWLTPHDWHQTAKATLSPGDYVLWRNDYEDGSKITVTQFTKKKGSKPGLDMLLGMGKYTTPQSQVKIPKEIVEAITLNAVQAWKKLPPPGTKGTTLSGIKQANEESYQDFVSRLEEAINRMLPLSEGTEMLLKQLAWENANSLCQDLIRPLKGTGTIQDYVKACVDASPAVVQGMAYAAAMKGQTYSAYVKKTYRGGKRDSSKPTCFKCGRTGHIQKMCRGEDKQERSRKGPTPGICP